MITVQATQTGYYTHLRRPGEIFEIGDELNEAGELIHFSWKWMRRLETPGCSSPIVVTVTKARFDGPIWRKPGDRFTIPNEHAFSEDWMAKQPQTEPKEQSKQV